MRGQTGARGQMAPREGFERQLRLAAYVGECRDRGCSIGEIAHDVPGFGELGRAALEKALQRDVSALKDSLGILIEWSAEENRYHILPPLFTPGQRRALIAAAAVVDVEGIGDELPPGELGAAVEAELARVVVRVHQRVIELRDAIADRRTITFTYQGTDGAPAVRRVDPFAVGLWRNRWYFVGFDHDRAGRRVFRLDRIVPGGEPAAITAVTGPDAYVIPDDVDPVAALQMDPNAWGTDTPLDARVRVTHDHVPMFLGELAGRVDEHDPDSSIVTVEVRDYESFVIRLLGFGTGVELLEPPELVDRLRSWLVGQVGA